MVDWSAAAVPRQGRDSIWICRRDGAGERCENPATRLAARQLLLDWLVADQAAGRSVLAGFDFPFGYPRGFAARLGLAEPAWRSIWTLLSTRITEAADNRNNRFAVAAALNRTISSGAAPFWGCPPREASDFLAMTHHRAHERLGLAEKRLADASIKGPQPVWKLAGAGCVGGQALTGIPVVDWLRRHPALADRGRLWPFETGLRLPPRGGVVFAEIYPSLVPLTRRKGEVKDEAQVRSIARHFAQLDEAGRLGALFAGDPKLTAEERGRIEAEEGWILGVPPS